MRRGMHILLICPLLTVPPAFAQDAGKQTASQTAPTHGHSRNQAGQVLINGEGASATLWAPDLTTQAAKIENGTLTLPNTGVDNYHALVVDQDWGYYRESLVQYFYRRGKPSGESPVKLFQAQKSALEVMPDPLPRGHHHYTSNEEWGFQLRFNGAPLANRPVTLETDNGSRLTATSDAHGRVRFRLPDDFPDIVENMRDRRSAGFLVSSEFRTDGKHYRSALAMDYRVDPAHWQSFELGLAVSGLGLLVGGVIGRVRPAGSATAARGRKA